MTRFFKIALLVAVVIGVSACSCRTRKVGDSDNIPVAGLESPLKDVHFAFDSFDLDPSARETLQANKMWLADNAEAKVQIEGHCDERGTNEYNMVLGANRARAAYEYLRSLGVEADRMSTVSYGEELPLDPRHNEEAWATNRRAHFNVQ